MFKSVQYVPFWFVWVIALAICVGLNFIIVDSSHSNGIVAKQARCNVADMYADHGINLKMQCFPNPNSTVAVENTIGQSDEVLAIIKSRKVATDPWLATCDVYQDGKIIHCKPVGD